MPRLPFWLSLLLLLTLPLRVALAGNSAVSLNFQVRPLASDRTESLYERYRTAADSRRSTMVWKRCIAATAIEN